MQETALQRRYAEMRSRIEVLFSHRDTPPPAIAFEDNPFVIGYRRSKLPCPSPARVPPGPPTSPPRPSPGSN